MKGKEGLFFNEKTDKKLMCPFNDLLGVLPLSWTLGVSSGAGDKKMGAKFDVLDIFPEVYTWPSCPGRGITRANKTSLQIRSWTCPFMLFVSSKSCHC
jgi:hypothetical protein